jgi:hypothetical protein
MSSSQREPAWQFFCDLLDLVMPQGGTAALLSAYLDASQMKSGVFSVGGFAFGRDRAKKASRDWHKLWGNTICHMTDLHSRAPGTAFEGWAGDQAGERLKNSVRIINRYASYAVCISCDLLEVERLSPKSASAGSEMFLDGFRHAYAICCHLAMALLSKNIREFAGRSDISYFFESGDQHQAESQRFIALAVTDPVLKRMYGYRSHTVADKGHIRLLETADIIAWEWAKHRDRIRNGQRIRPSLIAILDPDSSGHMSELDAASEYRRAVHLTGHPLERYFYKVDKFILS